MSNSQFNFNVDEFNSIFPFYILIDEELKIKCIGKSLAKLLPKEFIGSSFVDLFEFQRPHFDELNIQNINQTFNQLVIFNPKIDASISLRGQINSFNNNYLFVGTPWFSSIQDVVDKKLTLHDFAFHDPLLDLLHVLKNQEIHNEELKELLQTLNNQRKLLKKDKEELNKLSVVASANNNGVVFTKPDGTIYWCNDAYENLTGYSKEEIYGKTPVEIGRLPESSIDEIRKMVVAFGNNEPFDVEILHKTKSGKKFWSRTKGQPIKDANGTTIQYFAMVDDVSKEKIKEERLQILSSIADVNINAVIICDKDGKIEWVNNSFENITGYKLAEVIGKTPGSILQGEESNPDTVKYLRDQIKAGESFNCEILNYSKSKKKYWIRIQGQPLKDKNGELIKYFAIEEDISLEKNYYESIKSEKEKYSNIIANMNMGLLEVDNHDTILLANQSFCEMSGYTLLDLIGTKASDLLSNISDKKVIQTKNEMRSSGISDSYEVTAKTKDGQTKFWMISGAPNYNVNGEIVGSIGVHLDITQQKSLELQKEQLLARLEKQNEQLNEYAQIVSHDLKSPLRSIHSLISWIKEDNIGEFSPQSVEYLKMIENKVEKMDHLIHGILTYSKIDTLELTNEKINLNDVINNIINIIHIPDNIKVTIVSKLPTIVADKYRIQQLFQNLIGNAVTYIDKPNGLVEVDYIEEKQHYIFSIKDNGPGIAKENQEKIFKIFQSFTKHDRSTGIGLSIVKRIISNYNGDIWIESELNLGSTFLLNYLKNKMRIVQAYKKENQSWKYIKPKSQLDNPLVLVFGNRMLLENEKFINEVRAEFPYEHIVFGSTSGEILDSMVLDESIVVTAIEFEKSSFVIKTANILDFNKDSKELGIELYSKMPLENLKHLFVISEGSFVNGSSLINGLETEIHGKTVISGGLCGDDARFEKTLASYKENPKAGEVVMIGFYGETLEISVASFGGWTTFGPERLITKSNSNVLYEIDGLPALELYKKYLGDKADQLPQASLLYPLNVTAENKSKAVVRTILSINEEENSMTLAGDMPLNAKVQLMMASVDGLSEGAFNAAKLAMKERDKSPELALLVSCVGRKLVMNQRVEEEIEEVQNVIGKNAAITGFYSYGEMAPFSGSSSCELHNQTMTLTLISE